MDMEGVRHPDRRDLPDLCCSELRLDIDAADIKRLAVYSYERGHVGVATRLGSGGAQAAVKNELPPPHGGGWIDRRRLGQARR